MSIRDRINSFLNGGFVDAPSGGSSSDEELAELRDRVVQLTHDIEHIREDRAEIYKRLIRSRAHVVDLQAQLLASETAYQLMMGTVE